MGDRGQRGQHRGIGDEAVKPAPALGNRRGEARDGRRVLHVQLDNSGMAAGGPDVVIRFFQRAHRPAGDDQLRPRPRRGDCHRTADAAGRAGHKNKLAGKVHGLAAHQLELP